MARPDRPDHVLPHPRRGRGAAVTLVEPLELRTLLCDLAHPGPASVSLWVSPTTRASATQTVAGAASLAPNGLPLLHSLPGAAAAVYLDFDGSGEIYAGYDTDGDPATFSPAEQTDIAKAWRHVSSYFSVFNVDVTTEQPSVPYSYSLISNEIANGFNIGRFPSLVPTNYNASSHARTRQSALAHEIGHSFGLEHQALYDPYGLRLDEYHPGYDQLHGAIMGMDGARVVSKWFIGHPSSSPLALQDDVAVIAAKLAFTGNGGFRPDDVPGDFASAVPLSQTNGVQSASGIIERMADADAFSFTSAGGRVTVDLVPPRPSMLDAKLEVYSAAGTLLAAADGADNDQHLAVPTLAAGTYYAVVKSHGNYADLGPYDLSVREEEPGDVPPPQHNALPAPGGLALSLGAGTGIDLRWDAVPGATGYAVLRSDDGLTWATVAHVEGGDTTAYADAQLPGARRYFYSVSAADGSGLSPPSETATLVNRPGAVTDLSYFRWRTEAYVLNWRDTDGETGYRVERRNDQAGGGEWTVLAQLGPNVPSFTDRSFSPDTRYRYRVIPTSSAGDGPAADVVTFTPVAPVNGLRLVSRSASSLALAWDRIDGSVSYTIERSSNRVEFQPLATVTGASYTDSSVAPVEPYYYRVVAVNEVGDRAVSGALLTTTPAASPLPSGWSVSDIATSGPGAAARLAAGSVAFLPGDAVEAIGGGAGVDSDSFRFVYRLFSGNGFVTARVVVPGGPRPTAMAGLMIRRSNSASERFVFAGVSAAGFSGQRARTVQGGAPSNFDRRGGPAPMWLHVQRRGDVFEVFASATGSDWRRWASYTIPMGASALFGLVVASGSDGELSEAVFDHVAVGTATAPWIVRFPSVPAVTYETQLHLSALADDISGEEGLTYAWSVERAPAGAPRPTFSANNDNAARDVTATFHRAGNYALRLTVTNTAGATASSVSVFDVLPALTNLTVSPVGGPVDVHSSLRFTAAPFDQFGDPYAPPASEPPCRIAWSATWGTVGEDGTYSAAPWETGGWWDYVTAYAEAAGANATASARVYVYDDALAPTLLSAASRKAHGRRGFFDLPLGLYGAPPTVEPRRGGPTTLRLTFSGDVFPADGALGADDFDITGATFKSARASGPVLTVELSGAQDGSLVTVRLGSFVDGHGNALQGADSVQVLALYGDVDGSGSLDAKDLTAVRGHLLRPAAASDFLRDVDLDGFVTAADLLLVRRRLGGVVPVG